MTLEEARQFTEMRRTPSPNKTQAITAQFTEISLDRACALESALLSVKSAIYFLEKKIRSLINLKKI